MKAKKILAAFIAATMVLSTMSFTAFANEGTDATAPSTEQITDTPVDDTTTGEDTEASTYTNWSDEGFADTAWYSEDATEYTISTAAELGGLAKLVNEGKTFERKKITLSDNIDLDGYEWVAIGNSSQNNNGNAAICYRGEFDGNGKTISNLKNTQNVNVKGLFGTTNKGAYIHDVNLEKVILTGNASEITDSLQVGALIASLNWAVAENITINDVTIDVDTNNRIQGANGDGNATDGNYIGGLTGLAQVVQIKNVDVSGAKITVDNAAFVGGAVGHSRGYSWRSRLQYFPYYFAETKLDDSNIIQSYFNDVNVVDVKIEVNAGNGVSPKVGGMLGGDRNYWTACHSLFSNCEVSNLDMTCDGKANYIAGGFVGLRQGEDALDGEFAKISRFNNCTASGEINGGSGIYGGFVGQAGGKVAYYENASTSVDITCTDAKAGGFAGSTVANNDDNPTYFVNCVATGNIVSTGTAGGFVGTMETDTKSNNTGLSVKVEIEGCKAEGSVEGNTAGGLIGEINDSWTNGQTPKENIGGSIVIENTAATQEEVKGTGKVNDYADTTDGSKVGFEIKNPTTTPTENLKSEDAEGNTIPAPAETVSKVEEKFVKVGNMLYADIDVAIAAANNAGGVITKGDKSIEVVKYAADITDTVSAGANASNTVIEDIDGVFAEAVKGYLEQGQVAKIQRKDVVEYKSNADGKIVVDITPKMFVDGTDTAISFVDKEVKVTLKVDSIYNGKKPTIYHKEENDESKIDESNITEVADGLLTFTTKKGFSDYIIDFSDVEIKDELIAEKINVVFEKTDDERVYNIKLVGAKDKYIHRFTAARLAFDLIQAKDADGNAIGQNTYTIKTATDINKTPVKEDDGSISFYVNTKNVPTLSGGSILLGTVTFNGYGEFDFIAKGKVEYEGSKVETAISLDTDNSLMRVYDVADGTLVIDNTAATDDVDTDDDAIIDNVKLEEKKAAINLEIAFNNTIVNNAAAYQDMTVTIEGGADTKKVIELGTDAASLAAADEDVELINFVGPVSSRAYKLKVWVPVGEGSKYTITVEGAGYRTAEYTTTIGAEQDETTIKFWNNVMAAPVVMEVNSENNSNKAVTTNFLAGDIIMDGEINLYDLSAVVSYFDTNKITDTNSVSKYAKYDLNRDGAIDIDDITYVLLSWGK